MRKFIPIEEVKCANRTVSVEKPIESANQYHNFRRIIKYTIMHLNLNRTDRVNRNLSKDSFFCFAKFSTRFFGQIYLAIFDNCMKKIAIYVNYK